MSCGAYGWRPEPAKRSTGGDDHGKDKGWNGGGGDWSGGGGGGDWNGGGGDWNGGGNNWNGGGDGHGSAPLLRTCCLARVV